MRFLVTATSKSAAPPEVVPQLMDATLAWAQRNKELGRFQEVWSFAGLHGGGAIVSVDSPEELDAVMAEFPLAPFSDITIYMLVDLKGALERGKQAIQAMGI